MNSTCFTRTRKESEGRQRIILSEDHGKKLMKKFGLVKRREEADCQMHVQQERDREDGANHIESCIDNEAYREKTELVWTCHTEKDVRCTCTRKEIETKREKPGGKMHSNYT